MVFEIKLFISELKQYHLYTEIVAYRDNVVVTQPLDLWVLVIKLDSSMG